MKSPIKIERRRFDRWCEPTVFPLALQRAPIMFYIVLIQSGTKGRRRLDHTIGDGGSGSPAHKIESARSVARTETLSGIPRSLCLFFSLSLSSADEVENVYQTQNSGDSRSCVLIY